MHKTTGVRGLLMATCLSSSFCFAAEVVQLDEENWKTHAPTGKEVDCIYGDHVLASDRILAVVGEAVETRNANMTVKNVGGAVIDLVRRDGFGDQLSCYYPHPGNYHLTGPVAWPEQVERKSGAACLAFRVNLPESPRSAFQDIQMTVCYELADGEDFLTVHTLLINPTDKPLAVLLTDAVRADGEFKSGFDSEANLWSCHDQYWRGAYGITSQAARLEPVAQDNRSPAQIKFHPQEGQSDFVIPPGASLVFQRQLIPGVNSLDVAAVAAELQGNELADVGIVLSDSVGPVHDAYLEVKRGERSLGSARIVGAGILQTRLPLGEYEWFVTAPAHADRRQQVTIDDGENLQQLQLAGPAPGRVMGQITDDNGAAIPCKIAFRGLGVADPHFGPDSAVHGVRNLWYTNDGMFQVELAPGQYELLISHGPEYDAVLKNIRVDEDKTTEVGEVLVRSVNTTGWISADLHSHSSPSGDNTAAQRGRVLNLLAEHLEFIPCTEHQRITTYQAHLKHFDAERRVLTCSGMELTGGLLPVNHQNAFPLVWHPRTQDGGAPVIDDDPNVQIARLAMWDDQSDKVVQINHPNIAQMIGDKDQDGNPDGGFRRMFHFADVIEVHPPELIFDGLKVNEGGWDGRGTVIQNWMQLLNLGYRIPGVVNTDAHWNFHGSGWLRNYVRSTADDPAQTDLREICHNLEKGQVVMTNGPFMEVIASGGGKHVGPGEDLVAEGGNVELRIRVECPNWLDINRVQVFVNGRADEKYNFTRRSHGDMFGNGTLKFENTVPVSLDSDAHLIVATAAEGMQLGHVYGPDAGQKMPTAVSNPVFVDVNANGFEPNGDMLGVPLPVEPDHVPTHGHELEQE